ncbi:MAG: branched-chain amino acid ABC transporter permease [Variovorax sp.]|nr:MAG: branched-chain amino acid ABC transporter permease [Variovorax sp.]
MTRRAVDGWAEIAFWVALAAAVFALPDRLALMSQILIVGLFAVSLDLMLGYAGILSIGHAAFFGAGAYTAGLLARHGWGEPLSGLLAAAAVCAVLGHLLGRLVGRGADLTRLTITLGICMLATELVNRLADLTGGTDGLQGVAMWPVLGLFDFDLQGRTAFVYSFVVVLLVFMAVRRVVGSPFGLALVGIRDNPERMRAIGSPVTARLRTVCTLSAAVAGLAGALLAQTTQFVGIESIGFERSAEVLIVLVLGGTGRLYGGLVGALVYMAVHDAFADLDPAYWMFGLGLFLIAAALAGRGGLLGALAHLTQRRRP